MAAKLHQDHMTGSRDIPNGWILSGPPSYTFIINTQTEIVIKIAHMNKAT
jgi:hypothetical protein